MLMEKCVSADPTWDTALAVEIAFELGRYAAGEKVSVTEKQRVAGLATAARNKAKADAWQGPAKQIGGGQLPTGDKQRKTQPQVARKITGKVDGVRSYDRALELVENWDRGVRKAASARLDAAKKLC